ncbi:MAG: GNAT family N-acetyltransferase [Actinobacteria bacterium]|nr:MAG: GNAT family N-acetyltransferase [Actinomycetota bacterium]
MIIRRAEPGDAEGLTRLGEAVGSEPEGWLVTTNGWREVSDERRYLRAIRRYPNAAVFVAEDEGRIVGRLSIARDQHPASRHVADLGLMVAMSHRRRGIGTKLLEAALDWARHSEVRKLELHVFPHNEAAIKLYENFGFVQEGYRRGHYQRGNEYVDAILMAYEV